MAARQEHGFNYQEKVIKDLCLIPSTMYLSPNDAYYMDKGDCLVPIQVKCIKLGSSIDLGSYFVNKNKEKDFGLAVGFWEGNTENIVEEYLVFPPLVWWKFLFLSDPLFDNDISSFIKNASNDSSYDIEWKDRCKELLFRWSSYWEMVKPEFEQQFGIKCPKRVIVPRFKRDHKNQKRIQCSIPNSLFYRHFLKW